MSFDSLTEFDFDSLVSLLESCDLSESCFLDKHYVNNILKKKLPFDDFIEIQTGVAYMIEIS